MLDGFNKANTTARGFLRPILTMNSLYHRDAMQILCYITCTLTMYLYRSEYIFSICKFMKYVLVGCPATAHHNYPECHENHHL